MWLLGVELIAETVLVHFRETSEEKGQAEKEPEWDGCRD